MTLPLIAPLLATPGPLPPAAQDTRRAYETRQDGQHAVVHLPGDGTVTPRARSGEGITAAYPELRGPGAERAGLAALLRTDATDVCPFDPVPRVRGAHWVRPRPVGEVRYSTRTRSGLLRQPSRLRLRPASPPMSPRPTCPTTPYDTPC